MTDDLEFLFKEAIKKSRLSEALPTLNAMMKDKSEAEIRRLDEWIADCEKAEEERESEEETETEDESPKFRYYPDQIIPLDT